MADETPQGLGTRPAPPPETGPCLSCMYWRVLEPQPDPPLPGVVGECRYYPRPAVGLTPHVAGREMIAPRAPTVAPLPLTYSDDTCFGWRNH